MKNYISKILNAGFQPTYREIKNVLANEGFEIISEVKMHDRLKEEFYVDFKKFVIIGTQNSSFSNFTPGLDGENISYTQCKFIVYELSADETEIGCYNPIALNGFSGIATWEKTEKEIIKKLDQVMHQVEKTKSLIL